MHKLVLLRHGESTWNKENRFTGWQDVPLSEKGVKEATEAYYGIHDADFTWVETVRYMGIYHEVQPATHALRCLDCHGGGDRLDWQALGYAGDPMADCLPAS